MYSEIFSIGEIINYVLIKEQNLSYDAVIDDYFRITQLKGSKRYSLLMDIRNPISIDEKARNFLSSSKFKSKIKAMAVLVGSESSQEVLDFFVGMNTKKLKTRVFVEKEYAIDWLREF